MKRASNGRFTLGESVVMTDEAIRCGIAEKKRTGVIAGFNLASSEYVMVRVGNNKTASRYHSDFWEPNDRQSAGRRK